jgi:8-oxo-dGTP pyrophosphatase MutT (NUDIX family)
MGVRPDSGRYGVSRWRVHGERALYRSDWLDLRLVDVELPSGPRFEHHVVRMPRPAAAAVVHDPERGVLLIYRHRFITDSWGWEVPAGAIDPGETPADAARREAIEESGWEPTALRPVGSYFPTNGLCDQTFHILTADSARLIGDPVNCDETERVAWLPAEQVLELIENGDVRDGFSLTALLWTLFARSD